MAIDPICGMTVDESSPLRAQRDGQTYYFCCEHCRKRFLAQGDTQTTPPLVTIQLGGGSAMQAHGDVSHHDHARTVAPSATAKYFCPMCEGVESDTPGDCPKCGMALVPVTPMSAADDEESPELRDMTGRFWISALLTLPVFLLAMAPMLGVFAAQPWVAGQASRWVQFLLATPVVMWGGLPFFRRGWRSVATGHWNMFTLISLGIAAAYLFSAAAMLVPDAFPQSMRHEGEV